MVMTRSNAPALLGGKKKRKRKRTKKKVKNVKKLTDLYFGKG